ncbi:MAG: MBL fold metallo-hydrolase [Verrucomicrobia bacterium]|jgi:7,8-dihydropterin-6-yl-methyl-4-(beta-D-ribofuranosyl)aminobenzene 5'-phosphate synthase|nr:MBL fold metallo-hydrolase [Verrucomicrobiota bacterium]
MNESICITTLVENTVHQRGLKAEHGLAFHLQFGRHRVLFDTGQSDLLLHNACLLGLDLRQLDAIALSHGHYDHCGGLKAAWSLSPACRLHLHPAAIAAKFSVNTSGEARNIGMTDDTQEVICACASAVWTRGLTEVVPGLFATGEIPRQTDYEDVEGRFFLDAKCQQPDPLMDDQALFFESREGLVVLFGCAHSGVVNTLLHIERLTGGKRIHAILGGMHLLNASPERLQKTIAALGQRDLRLLVPMHCTGWPATPALWNHFGNRCVSGGVGSQQVFSR